MKVVVIGTSNFVRKDGWLNGLESIKDIEVIDYSRGRVPCLMHLVSILEHKKIIQNADLLILDHSANDLNKYLEHFEDDYYHYIEDLLAIASSVNKPVINLFLPVMRNFFIALDTYLNKVVKLCIKHNIYYINFNNYEFKDYLYDDKVHLKREVAFFIGQELGILLKTKKFNIRTNIGIENNPYKILSCRDIVHSASRYSDNDITIFKNSLAEFKYIPLNSAISLSHMKDTELIAIAYFNELDKNHFFQIETQNYSFPYQTTGQYFFLEMIDSPIFIDDKTYLKLPDNLTNEIPTLFGRRLIPRKMKSGINISYLLFKDNSMPLMLTGDQAVTNGEFLINVESIMQKLPITFFEKEMNRKDEMKKTALEIAQQIQKENFEKLGNINEKKIAMIIRKTFVQIKKEIDNTKSDTLDIIGFGKYRIRMLEQRDKKGETITIRQIIFRPAKEKK